MPALEDGSFKHIRRTRDSRFEHDLAVIMPGQYFVSQLPMVIYTILGSCISVCIRDPLLNIAGMNHFMLPAPNEAGGKDSWSDSARYGSFAMELLINDILKRGGKKNRFEIKVFGGAKIYEGDNDVGASNASWIMKYLHREGLKPLKTDVGDIFPRKIYFYTDTGKVLMKKIDRMKNRTILEQEENYREELRRSKKDGDVTLF